jgi:hypothetical protein
MLQKFPIASAPVSKLYEETNPFREFEYVYAVFGDPITPNDIPVPLVTAIGLFDVSVVTRSRQRPLPPAPPVTPAM